MLVVAFRGTSDVLDVLTDVNLLQTPYEQARYFLHLTTPHRHATSYILPPTSRHLMSRHDTSYLLPPDPLTSYF